MESVGGGVSASLPETSGGRDYSEPFPEGMRCSRNEPLAGRTKKERAGGEPFGSPRPARAKTVDQPEFGPTSTGRSSTACGIARFVDGTTDVFS